MKVKDLDGLEYKLKVTNCPRDNASKLHLTAEEKILELFPAIVLCHEIPIRVNRRTTLYLDIFLPTLRIAFEVQGQQHYKLVSFFHSDKRGFLKQKNTDELKRRWCELNNIELVELKYDGIAKWGDIIRSSIGHNLK